MRRERGRENKIVVGRERENKLLVGGEKGVRGGRESLVEEEWLASALQVFHSGIISI